jgi:hypothetical protein
MFLLSTYEMIRAPLAKTNKTSQKRKEITDPVETRSTALVRFNQPEQVRLFDYYTCTDRFQRVEQKCS